MVEFHVLKLPIPCGGIAQLFDMLCTSNVGPGASYRDTVSIKCNGSICLGNMCDARDTHLTQGGCEACEVKLLIRYNATGTRPRYDGRRCAIVVIFLFAIAIAKQRRSTITRPPTKAGTDSIRLLQAQARASFRFKLHFQNFLEPKTLNCTVLSFLQVTLSSITLSLFIACILHLVIRPLETTANESKTVLPSLTTTHFTPLSPTLFLFSFISDLGQRTINH